MCPLLFLCQQWSHTQHRILNELSHNKNQTCLQCALHAFFDFTDDDWRKKPQWSSIVNFNQRNPQFLQPILANFHSCSLYEYYVHLQKDYKATSRKHVFSHTTKKNNIQRAAIRKQPQCHQPRRLVRVRQCNIPFFDELYVHAFPPTVSDWWDWKTSLSLAHSQYIPLALTHICVYPRFVLPISRSHIGFDWKAQGNGMWVTDW